MQILVDHLTRMAAGHICVAGIDDEGDHIRPVFDGERLPVYLAGDYGGPFSIGASVELGTTRAVGAAPEVEDHLFELEQCQQTHPQDPDRLWEILSANAELTLVDVFGHDLRNEGRGAVVPPGAGKASLGTLSPGYRPRILIVDGKLRCMLADPDLGELDLSITDLRFYTERKDGWAINEEAVQVAQRDLEAGRPAFLSVGLGRPWPESNPMHWLQVNGIHLEPDTEHVARQVEASYSVEEIRKEHPHAYEAWTEDEETLLRLLFERDLPVEQMSKILGRQKGGIKSRLRKLGLVE